MLFLSPAVTSASWADTTTASRTRLRRTMRPWVQRSEKPASSTSRTPQLTPLATTLLQSTPPSLMTPSADTGRTESRNSNTTTLSLTLAWATSRIILPAACLPGTASPRRSQARQTEPGFTRALPAAGRGIPTACRPLWATKISPAVLERAAFQGASPCPCLLDTAPVWAV